NMQRQAYRKGMTKGAQVINRAAKQNARKIKDTGLLAKSIGYSISRDMQRAKIGARRGFRVPSPKPSRKTKSGYIDPFNYAHLVELGTRTRITKTGVNRGSMKATPFLQPAIEQKHNEALAAVARGMKEGLARAIER